VTTPFGGRASLSGRVRRRTLRVSMRQSEYFGGGGSQRALVTADAGDVATGAVRAAVVGIGATAYGVDALFRLRGERGDAPGS